MTAATFCPECGPAVAIDEDGCCTGCGATATGSAIDRMNHALESERAARLAAEARESALRQALGRAVRALRLADRMSAALPPATQRAIDEALADPLCASVREGGAGEDRPMLVERDTGFSRRWFEDGRFKAGEHVAYLSSEHWALFESAESDDIAVAGSNGRPGLLAAIRASGRWRLPADAGAKGDDR